MHNILEIRNLTKKFKEFTLQDVSFSMPAGYVMGFIGPNGAGKTTTIKAVPGMLNIDSGEIDLFGEANTQNPSAIRDKLGIVMDLPFYVDTWSINDVEKAVAPFYSKWDYAQFTALLQRFDLSRTKKIMDLSRGMKVKLMISVALSHGAQLLILDEPTSGLDPVARDELLDILQEFMSDETRGVLFSTHITADLEKIADYITYIKNGKIVFTGLKDDLMGEYKTVKGGPSEVNAAQKNRIIGYREHATGFEGMVKTKDLPQMPASLLTEPVSLDEIVIYMNRG